jgi:methionine--tRNA ligase beta chain
LRYVADLPTSAQLGGILLVAGFISSVSNITTPEQEKIIAPWRDTPIDFEKIKKITRDVRAIFSEGDVWIPIENKKVAEEKLGAKTYIEDGQGERRHFGERDGVTELPKALELILEMSAAPIISIDDVVKLEIKMGKIISVERVEGSDKLLKFVLEFGSDKASEKRTIVSGVAGTYSPEEMLGKQVPVITNLAPRKLKGVESQGMIIYAIDETPNPETGVPMHKAIMLNPQREVPPGSLVQ